MDRSRGRLTAGRFRWPGPDRTTSAPVPVLAAAMAVARGAGPRHAKGSPAMAARRAVTAAGPRGTEHVAGHRGHLRAGSRAGRHHRAGRPRLASAVPGRTWVAAAGGRPGWAAVPSRCLARVLARVLDAVRPGIRAVVARSPYGPRRAVPRPGRREVRQLVRPAKRQVMRGESRRVPWRGKRRPQSAGGRPRERHRAPGAWSALGGRRTRRIWPRPESPASPRRAERRSGHPVNTRSSGPAPVAAHGRA
jgi:hypothetical protein